MDNDWYIFINYLVCMGTISDMSFWDILFWGEWKLFFKLKKKYNKWKTHRKIKKKLKKIKSKDPFIYK